MSRRSEAKRARRRGRQAARDAVWTPVVEETAGSVETTGETGDAIAEAVAEIDDWMAARGWLLDPDSLAEDIVALEAYRPGAPRPALA